MPDTDISVRRRLYRAQLGAYVLIVIVGMLGFWQQSRQQDDIIEGQVAACETANDQREGQRKIWAFFFTVSKASAKSQNQPQVVLDFYDDYLQWIEEEVLKNRDCSDLTKTYPEPGPPPSFEEALKEAQEQEEANE